MVNETSIFNGKPGQTILMSSMGPDATKDDCGNLILNANAGTASTP